MSDNEFIFVNMKAENMKDTWLILRVGGNQHILSETNEQAIKSLMKETYQPFEEVVVLDYLSGEVIEVLTMSDLWGV